MRLGLNRLLFALLNQVRQAIIGELSGLGVINFICKYLDEVCFASSLVHKEIIKTLCERTPELNC